MAFTLIDSHGQGSTNGATFTSSARTTTGADILLLGLTDFNSGTLTPSDSKGNTWTALTSRAVGNTRIQSYYAKNAIVGTGHTFTCTSSAGSSPALVMAAFSGSHLTAPFDAENGTTATGTTIQNGSVTPAENNELLAVFYGHQSAVTTLSIDGGFTKAQQVAYGGGGVCVGASIAYLIQTTAAAANPTWTMGTSVQCSTNMAAFKIAAAGGSIVPPLRGPTESALIKGRLIQC